MSRTASRTGFRYRRRRVIGALAFVPRAVAPWAFASAIASPTELHRESRESVKLAFYLMPNRWKPDRSIPACRGLLLLAALVLSLGLSAIPASAQAAKLADGPPPPEDAAAPSTTPDSAPNTPSDTASPPDYGSPPAADSSGPANGIPGGPSPAAAPGSVDGATADAKTPPTPAWDPLHANKSVEVGTFYMRKGDYDAAIDRFEEAARLQPGLARPYLLLGEVYEKKNDPASAVSAYRTYLKLYRTAPDREKILERIERLQSKIKHDPAPSGSG
jgi:tetratricopeptide (TPR) repeat protein